MVDALRNYQKMNNGALPDQVIVYRDSVGGPTLQAKCLQIEVPNVIKVL